ncbi:MAG TPA: asparagine synthase (glutamine-hydrolyzing) [Thermoanaerobaculia bacterium]
MCGINLIYAFRESAPSVDREELRRTRDAMRFRGPDDCGEWHSPDGRLSLGHRRLSIIDVSEHGHQPMLSADGRYAIVFNGEIYNYKELRADLERAGLTFHTHSDTEVLLAMFAREGEAMLMKLRGMFALAIWDSRERSLFLARDPYGIKPLYYAIENGVLRVASQVKALLAGGGVSREVDPAGIVGFLVRGTVPQPFTTHTAIRALQPGHHATIASDGDMTIHRYFSLAEVYKSGVERAHKVPHTEWHDLVTAAIQDSVRYHLVADVPLGAFLSAGKDSTTVVALACEAGYHDLTGVTIRTQEFAGSEQDEAPLATVLARHYGFNHIIRTVTREEFHADLPRILAAMDQPTIDGWNSYYVSKAAGELGMKVMLSGTGGDELFGGYTTFRKIPRFVKTLRGAARVPGLAGGFRRFYNTVRPRKSSPKSGSSLIYAGDYAGAYLLKRGLFMPEELPGVLPRELVQEGLKRLALRDRMAAAINPDPGNPFARVAALESTYFLGDQLLRDIDWTSMSHSVEVRVPLVDAHLLMKIAPVIVAAHDYEKKLLTASPAAPLPREILHRPKTGFLLPIREWIRPEAGSPHTFGMRSLALMLTESLLAT